MPRYQKVPAYIAFVMLMILGYPVKGQVFVHTVLDRTEQPAGSQEKLQALADNQKTNKLVRVFKFDPLLAVAKMDRPTKQKMSNAEIDDKLKDLGTLPADEAQVACDTVGAALANRWLPVRWKSERSACVWAQQSLDFARGAQVVGSENQGTASVELASDVFWGLRVRIQTSVSGTDSGDSTDKAKAALKQLQTAGGNISFGATYPWRTLTSSAGKVKGLFTSYVRISGSLPALGGNDTTGTGTGTVTATGTGTGTGTEAAKDTNGNVELAPLDAMILINSFKDTIDLVMTGRAAFVNGTRAFNDQIKNTGHRGFMYNQIGIGLRFQDVVWVIASRANYSHNLPGGGMTYSVVFAKNPTPPASK